MDVRFFLGANSGAGFYSLYDGFCCGEGDFLNLIKAGPGGGKSSFMRAIAAAAAERGYDTECILCSGDPDSLDAVYIPELHLGYMDATAPHAGEPGCFAHDSRYVNLGEFCERISDPRAVELTDKYRSMYKTAYAYLTAAASVENVQLTELASADIIGKVRSRAKRVAERELGRKASGSGRVYRRFVRCISCSGELVLAESVRKLCKRIYLLDDRYSLAQEYLDELLEQVKIRGENAIVCPSPLLPERLEAVLLPECSAGFVLSRVMPDEQTGRHIRLDALLPRESAAAVKAELRKKEKLARELTDEAVRWLARAKEYHDELERVYNPHVDFCALDNFCKAEIERIFA